MPSLTHIRMFKEHGWAKITVDEASAQFPETVQAKSGVFMCELCHQYASLTKPGKNARHFRHTKSDDNSCPERTLSDSTSIDCSAEKHDLPIRLRITPSGFELELGLLPISESVLHRLQNETIQILLDQVNDCPVIYRLKERLRENEITYVSLGEIPYPEYKIEISCKNHPAFRCWPERIRGILPTGTLFDLASRKKIPYDANIQVKKDYYLLRAGGNWPGCSSISWQLILSKRINGKDWHLYRITATAFDEKAARFFLTMHCRLTDQPISIHPIWPVHTVSPYVIHHHGREMVFFVQGDVETKCFPSTYSRRILLGEGKALECVPCRGRQQLVSVGHSYQLSGEAFWRRLKYTYIWYESIGGTTAKPVVIVTNFEGQAIPSGTANTLPLQRSLRIQAPYDGLIVIKQKGIIVEKRQLKAETLTNVDSIQFGCEIQIFQGLDCVWCVQFQPKTVQNEPLEQQILKKLTDAKGSLIPVPHTWGAAVKWLEPYPKIKQWLYQQIRKGWMPETAYFIFRQLISHVSK